MSTSGGTDNKRSPICRTVDDAFAAGWDDGATDKPMTPAQRLRLVALLAPHVQPHAEAA
jgi:hypothetical protein